MIKRLSLPALEYLTTSIAKVLNTTSEVIPNIYNRFPGKLEHCLAAPFMSFGGKNLYPTIEDKCSIMFYLIIKNHPLENGNKRLACLAILSFLMINKKWLKVNHYDLKALTAVVVNSTPHLKDQILYLLKMVIKSKMHNLPSIKSNL